MACAVFAGNLMFAIVVGIIFSAYQAEDGARQARVDAQAQHQALNAQP
jgi:hypothetical protein